MSCRATGVAYAGYQEPADAGTSLLWLGRADLVTPGGAWQTIDVTSRSYTWAKYDMTTHQLVENGPGVPTTVAGFAAAHGGDGPGVYTIGFGCDGTPFSMDRLQVGAPGAVTTYDLEGLQTAVTIARALTQSGHQFRALLRGMARHIGVSSGPGGVRSSMFSPGQKIARSALKSATAWPSSSE